LTSFYTQANQINNEVLRCTSFRFGCCCHLCPCPSVCFLVSQYYHERDWQEVYSAGNDFVDDVLARDEFPADKITAREFSEIHSRHADEIYEAKRDLERLERLVFHSLWFLMYHKSNLPRYQIRRSRSVCYAGCAIFTGQNKVNCWRKCDAIWGRGQWFTSQSRWLNYLFVHITRPSLLSYQ